MLITIGANIDLMTFPNSKGANSLSSEQNRYNQSELELEILRYLAEHPDAQDTFKGIIDWWLLKKGISFSRNEVRDALNSLIDEGLLLKFQTHDSHTHYKINSDKYLEVRKRILNNSSN